MFYEKLFRFTLAIVTVGTTFITRQVEDDKVEITVTRKKVCEVELVFFLTFNNNIIDKIRVDGSIIGQECKFQIEEKSFEKYKKEKLFFRLALGSEQNCFFKDEQLLFLNGKLNVFVSKKFEDFQNLEAFSKLLPSKKQSRFVSSKVQWLWGFNRQFKYFYEYD